MTTASAPRFNNSHEIQSLVDRALDTPAEKRGKLIGEMRRPQGTLAKVVQEFRLTNPDLFRSLFPELTSPSHNEPAATPSSSIENFMNRFLDATPEQQRTMKGEVFREDGSLTGLGEGLDLELLASLFFQIDSVPNSEQSLTLPKKLFSDMASALAQIDLEKQESVKAKISELQKKFQSRDAAMSAVIQLYSDLPALVGEKWDSSQLRLVLGKALSQHSVPVDEDEQKP